MVILTTRARTQLRVMSVVVFLACVLTPAFNMLTNEVSIDSALQGLVDALLVSVALSAYIIFVRDGVWRVWLRERSFVANLLINGTVMLTLYLLMRGLGQVVTSGDPSDFAESFSDTHLSYALPFFVLVAFAFQFVLQMNRMVGTNVLRYFLTGVYHQPKEEERIFMFLDLESSSQIAERLGSSSYYRMLRCFVDDLSEPILESEGEIYQYVGDEVVITWQRESGLRQANCLLCFFRIQDAIALRAAGYEREFGIVPKFRAGMHGGWVTGGELGDLRQEIVFVGDILNTAARLEEYARQHNRRFVASGELIGQLQLPEDIRAEKLEEFRPRGKEHTVTVYSLSRTGVLAAERA
jgi:adenylate cyclase